MAQETNPQPQLHTLVALIQQLSPSPVTKATMAAKLNISPERFSRILAREKNGVAPPAHYIPMLTSQYKDLLGEVRTKVTEEGAISLLTVKVMRLEAAVSVLLSFLKETVGSERYRKIEASMQTDEVKLLEKWKASGTF